MLIALLLPLHPKLLLMGCYGIPDNYHTKPDTPTKYNWLKDKNKVTVTLHKAAHFYIETAN